MTTDWKISIDWERNGSFDDSYNDITTDVMKVAWFLGSRRPYGDIAEDGMLQLVLKNDTQHYSPENHSSPLSGKLVPYRPVRIQYSTDAGVTWHTLWIGWIETLRPTVGINGERQTRITAAGPLQFMRQAQTQLPIQEQVRTDEIMQQLLLEVVTPPAMTNVAILGRARLGVDTVLGSASDLMSLETGQLTLTLAGDNWVHSGESADSSRDTFSVLRAIRDVTAAERGRFFFRRDGKAVFWNRNHLLTATDPAATLDNSMRNLQYSYADIADFHNEIVVTCRPRSISATNDETLWELKQSITVPTNGQRTIRAKFEDEGGGRVGGRNTSLTYSFSSESGTVSLIANANNAQLSITNTGTTEAVLDTCIIKGQKILDLGRMDALAWNDISIAEYGRRAMNISIAALSDLDEALSIAEFELERRKDPRGIVRSVTLRSHGTHGGNQHTLQLGLTIGDVITIKEDQTSHEEAYFIIGESHQLSDGKTLFETQWYLEPVTIAYLAQYDKRYQDAEYMLNDGINDRLSQSFIASASQPVQSVRLWLRRVGNPTGQLSVELRAEQPVIEYSHLGTIGEAEIGTTLRLSASAPYPGTLITNGTSDTINASDVDDSYQWVEFTFATSPTLTKDTQYYLVLNTTGTSSATDTIIWGADNSDSTYSEGVLQVDKTAKWINQDADACFLVLAA